VFYEDDDSGHIIVIIIGTHYICEHVDSLCVHYVCLLKMTEQRLRHTMVDAVNKVEQFLFARLRCVTSTVHPRLTFL